MNKDNVVFTEDEVKLTGINLPWRDVLNLLFQIVILTLPVSFLAFIFYFMCMAAFGGLISAFS